MKNTRLVLMKLLLFVYLPFDWHHAFQFSTQHFIWQKCFLNILEGSLLTVHHWDFLSASELKKVSHRAAKTMSTDMAKVEP